MALSLRSLFFYSYHSCACSARADGYKLDRWALSALCAVHTYSDSCQHCPYNSATHSWNVTMRSDRTTTEWQKSESVLNGKCDACVQLESIDFSHPNAHKYCVDTRYCAVKCTNTVNGATTSSNERVTWKIRCQYCISRRQQNTHGKHLSSSVTTEFNVRDKSIRKSSVHHPCRISIDSFKLFSFYISHLRNFAFSASTISSSQWFRYGQSTVTVASSICFCCAEKIEKSKKVEVDEKKSNNNRNATGQTSAR